MKNIKEFINRNIVIIFLFGFVSFYFAQTIFPVKNAYTYFLYGFSILLWLSPLIAWGAMKGVRTFYHGKLAKSLFTIVGFGLFALICFFVQSEWMLAKPIPFGQEQPAWHDKVQFIMKVLYLLALATSFIYALLFRYSLEAMRSDVRRVSLLRTMFFNISLLLLFLFLVNYAARIRPVTIDMTTMRKYTLSSNGRSLIAGVNKKVKIYAFYPYFHEYQREVSLMLDDIKASNPLIEFQFLDALRDKREADEHKISSNGMILFTAIDKAELDMNKREKKRMISVTSPEDLKKMEREFVAAILGVTQTRKKIYFTGGHGEPSYSGPVVGELVSIIEDDLKQQSYDIFDLTPQTGFPGKMPDDAAVIVIISPKKDFQKEEKEALKKYMFENNGRMLLALDPETKADFSFILKHLNYVYKKERVFSEVSMKTQRDVIISTTYNSHPAVARFINYDERNRYSLWAGTGYFEEKQLTAGSLAGYEITQLVKSNFRSWIDTISNGVNDAKQEPMKAFVLGFSAERKRILPAGKNDKVIDKSKSKGLKIAALADGDLLTNQFIGYGKNQELATNLIKWLVEDERLMGIMPKKWEEANVKLTGGWDDFVFYFLIVFWPLSFLAVGFIKQRRRKAFAA